MKRFLNHMTAALTVALLFASPVAYSRNADHDAIAGKFESTYGAMSGTGLIVQTQEDGRLGATVIGIDTTTEQLCSEFTSVSPNIDYVILSKLNGRYSYRACN